jgi:hypothetical protein
MSSNRGSNQLVVPQANAALDQMKFEVAQELGIAIPQDGYYVCRCYVEARSRRAPRTAPTQTLTAVAFKDSSLR